MELQFNVDDNEQGGCNVFFFLIYCVWKFISNCGIMVELIFAKMVMKRLIIANFIGA